MFALCDGVQLVDLFYVFLNLEIIRSCVLEKPHDYTGVFIFAVLQDPSQTFAVPKTRQYWCMLGFSGSLQEDREDQSDTKDTLKAMGKL